MAESNEQNQRSKSSKTRRTFEVAGVVPESESFKNFPPVVWVAELVQHLVAVLLLAIGKMLQLTFRKEPRDDHKRHAS